MHRKGRYRVGSLPLIIQCSYYHPTKKRRGFKFSCVKPWFVGSMEAKQNRMSISSLKTYGSSSISEAAQVRLDFLQKKSEIGHPHTVNKCTHKDVCISAIFYPILSSYFFYLQAGSPRLAADWQWPALTWKRKKLGTSRRVEALLFRAAVQFCN